MVILLLRWLSAQVGGNQLYQDSRSYTPDPAGSAVQLARTDSTFILQARVLLHIPADKYLVTFGLSHIENTPQACNKALNRRIVAFTSSLKGLGISEGDIFIDLIAQSKVYDYEIEQNIASEYLVGFKVQKNVIIRCESHDDIARMLDLAAEQQIYDLVAVEYISTDEEGIYSRLFDAAAKVLARKRKAWLQLSGAEVKPAAAPFREHFYSIQPESRYRSYEAKDSGGVSNANRKHQYVIKEVPRERTFFYDPLNLSGFDKVLNPAPVEVGLAYVLELQMEYELEK